MRGNIIEPVERVSIIDNVATQLKELVLSGSMKVGDKFLTEKEICERTRVGRSTVREAMRILEAMGLLKIRPGRGAFISRTTEDSLSELNEWFAKHAAELSDYIEVRMAIEPLALRLAIERSTEDDREEIARVHRGFMQAVEENDVIKLATYDDLFHSTIVRASHNQLLVLINDSISKYLSEYRTKSFAIHENVYHAVGPHTEILECIEKHDIEGGQVVMVNHLRISLADILESQKKD